MKRSIGLIFTIIILIASSQLFGQQEFAESSYFYFPRVNKKKIKEVTVFLHSGERVKGYIYDINESGAIIIPDRVKDPMDIVLSNCKDCILIKHDEIEKMLFLSGRMSTYVALGLGVGMAIAGFITFEASKPHIFLEGYLPSLMGISGGLLTLTSGVIIIADEANQNSRQRQHKEGEVCYRCESFRKLTLLSMVKETAKKQKNRFASLAKKVKTSPHLYLQEYNIYHKDSLRKLKGYFVSMHENTLFFSPDWSRIVEQRMGDEGEIIEINMEDLLFIEIIND